jgi:hypothetical protein
MATNTITIVDKEKILRGVVGASWVLYVLTFIPFRAEYLIQWVFAGMACLGFVVTLLSVFKVRFWKAAAIFVAVSLWVVYVDYWVWITEMARSSKPELTSPLALGHVIEQGWTIFHHHLANGAILGALKVVYFELLMPLVQFVVLVAFFLSRASREAHPADRSAS